MSKPIWLLEAEKHIGEREVPGNGNNPWIVSLWKAIKRGGIKSDAVPWCAAFVGGCLEAVGLISSRYESAKSYLTWGVKLHTPVIGCIVVFEREGGGHVGFVVGRDPEMKLLVLGGNQGDEVNVRSFPVARVVGYRWPAAVPLPDAPPLPIFASAQESVSEA